MGSKAKQKLFFNHNLHTNKTDHHDITEILLKVVLNTIILTPQL
jgi:hypothetical protein